MSMISAQCDELRKAAQTYRTLGRYDMEQTLLDAAELILELRDDLQRANAAVQEAEHDESMAWDRVRKAEAENAKLRELVEDMLSCIEIRAAFGRPPTDEMYETFAQRARELGIEVDG